MVPCWRAVVARCVNVSPRVAAVVVSVARPAHREHGQHFDPRGAPIHIQAVDPPQTSVQLCAQIFSGTKLFVLLMVLRRMG